MFDLPIYCKTHPNRYLVLTYTSDKVLSCSQIPIFSSYLSIVDIGYVICLLTTGLLAHGIHPSPTYTLHTTFLSKFLIHAYYRATDLKLWLRLREVGFKSDHAMPAPSHISTLVISYFKAAPWAPNAIFHLDYP